MIIIWGTKILKRRKGVVADDCPLCAEVRPFAVEDRRLWSHLYFVPLVPQGKPDRFRRCQACRLEMVADADYAAFVPPREADRLEVGELLAATRPDLADARAEQERRRASARAGNDEARQDEIGVKLAAAGDDTLIEQWTSWHQLDWAGKAKLEQAADAAESQGRSAGRAAFYALRMAQTATNNGPILVTICLLAGIILGTLAGFGASVSGVPDHLVWIAPVIVGVLAITAAVICSTGAVRRALRKQIAEAEAMGIDPAIILAVLQTWRSDGTLKKMGPNGLALNGRVRLLQKMLAEMAAGDEFDR